MLEYVYNFISACVVGIIGWSFHTSNRITRLEQSQIDLKEYLTAIFTARFDAQVSVAAAVATAAAASATSANERLIRIEKVLNGSLWSSKE